MNKLSGSESQSRGLGSKQKKSRTEVKSLRKSNDKTLPVIPKLEHLLRWHKFLRTDDRGGQRFLRGARGCRSSLHAYK